MTAAGALAALPAAPAAGDPSSVSSVTLVSETGAFVGDGRAYMYSPSNGGTVRLEGGPADITVTVASRQVADASGDFTLRLVAPPGEVLARGTYEDAHDVHLSERGRAGLDVGGSGRGCGAVQGRFTVLDIAHTGGEVQRLHVLYEQRCEGAEPAVFGEIRYRMPGGDTELLVAPGTVGWPTSYPGRGQPPSARDPGQHRLPAGRRGRPAGRAGRVLVFQGHQQ